MENVLKGFFVGNFLKTKNFLERNAIYGTHVQIEFEWKNSVLEYSCENLFLLLSAHTHGTHELMDESFLILFLSRRHRGRQFRSTDQLNKMFVCVFRLMLMGKTREKKIEMYTYIQMLL